jgi:DNA phosphorothioation-dependent restriction protein DptH
MPTATQLYRLTEDVIADQYARAIFDDLKGLLQAKQPGHCQRLDYLPRPVMDRLGQRLSQDADLVAKRVVARVLSDKPGNTLEPWETTGTGAVALREEATYGKIRVFCALFPAGIRLAEEDSLNIATFKTDDAESFNVSKCLERHLLGRVNLLPQDERNLLIQVLNADAVRTRPVHQRFRYVLAVLGQREASHQPVNWELAGAYLYELNLIPDFDLKSGSLNIQVARNHECVKVLLSGDKTLGQNLEDLAEKHSLQDETIRKNLAVYLADRNTLIPEAWLPDICHDDDLRDKLSFESWKFATPTTGVHITLKPLQDPKKPTKVVKGIEFKGGVLTNDGKTPIEIKWDLTPKDNKDVSGFRIYLLRATEEGNEIDVIAPQTATAKRKSFKVPVSENNLEADEKCVARIRIQVLGKNGTPIQGAQDDSEEFWIETGTVTTPPPPEKGRRLRHLDELTFRSTYKTGKAFEIRHRGWDAARDNVFSVRLNDNTRGDLVLNPLLKALERKILENPNTLGVYQAIVVNRRRADLEHFEVVQLTPPVNQAASAFYHARSKFFAIIRDAEEGTGVIEAVDLHEHSAEVVEYVNAYLELLAGLRQQVEGAAGPGGINNVLHDYGQVMRIDTALMTVGSSEDPMEVLLLAPTHPLRVLWLYQYQSYVRTWIQQMTGKDPDAIKVLIAEDSIDKIIDLNIPNAISWAQGRAFVNTDNLDLFWSVLPNANIPDLRTAVSATLQAIGAGRKEVVISTVSPTQLADKMRRYLCHHPYVRTLKINVINPGDASVLLEAIVRLIEDELYRSINFDIKFFTPPGTKNHLVAGAFDELMEFRDDRDYSAGGDISEEEEHLLQPNANPLFPKLIYAKHSMEDLLADANSRFESHLTLVIDYFGTSVATRPHSGPPNSSALHNLMTEYVTDYTPGKTTATWSRLVCPNQCPPLVSDGNTERLFQAQDALSQLASCFHDWGKSLDKRVTIQLELTDEHGKNHQKMLRKAHLTSDWVFTIDRNFGIEYYDDPTAGPAGESGGYLIDYTPEFLDAISHRLIISTYHQHEIESILKRGFAKLLETDDREAPALDSYQVGRILQVLKSVSGKLALKLINNPSQAQEVIGLALTRLHLEREARLTGGLLIPVDSHIQLFHQTPKELENSELTLKRTDLILARFEGMKLNLDLIEVKNYKYTSPQKLLELQAAIRDKNKNTEAHFKAHFLGGPGLRRLDSDIKNKELANILAFYFDRANRYKLFAPGDAPGLSQAAADQFHHSLEAVEAGVCEVSFRYSGYIFNSSSLKDEEQISFQHNQVLVVGRPGIAGLLDLMLDQNGNEPESEGPGPEDPGPGEAPPSGGSTPETPPSSAGGSVPGASLAPHSAGGSTKPSPASPVDGDSLAAVVAPQPPQDELNIYLGTNTVTGKPAYWNPYITKPRKLSNQHVLVVGKSGAGKSETTKALVWELSRHGVPSIIFDYQGEYAAGGFFDAVKPQVFDVMKGLPINPFELPIDPLTGKKRPYIEMVFRLSDTLNSVFAGSGDIQIGTLREAIDLCYQQHGFDRDNAESWENEPPTLEMLEAVLGQMAADRGAQVKNLQVRLQPLFKSGIFRKDKAEFQFEDLFKKTTVILLTAGIKDLMLAASRFILEKVYSAMLMAGVSKKLRVMAVVDEAHKLCGDETVTALIKEARKYGLGVILSSQETRDFHRSVFANTGTLIGLALEEEDAGVMSRYMGLTDKTEQTQAKEMLLYQANGQALVRSQHFLPYAQLQIHSFEDRLEEFCQLHD